MQSRSEMVRTYVIRALTLTGFVLVLTLLVGVLIGQPVLLSFVTSPSMSPTIQEQDGFVAIPEQVTGEFEEGDVIVFEAEEIQGGGLTTHRIVGETEKGYITRGDGNEPPVTDGQIVAVAWQPGGKVVTIPALGTVILGSRVVITNILSAVTSLLGIEGLNESRQAGSVLLLSGLALFVLSVVNGYRTNSTRQRARSRGQDTFDPRYLALFFLAIVIVPANAAMVLPSSIQQVPIGDIATETGTEPGEPVEIELSADNEGSLVTMLVVFESSTGSTIEDRWLDVPGGATDSTTVTAVAPSREISRVVEISESRYIVVLPPTLLVTLHDIHPVLAVGAVNASLAFGILTVVLGLLGVRKRRVREADRGLPLYLRIKRRLR